jgi:hypothetical protein
MFIEPYLKKIADNCTCQLKRQMIGKPTKLVRFVYELPHKTNYPDHTHPIKKWNQPTDKL